jgi:hypothetical protein
MEKDFNVSRPGCCTLLLHCRFVRLSYLTNQQGDPSMVRTVGLAPNGIAVALGP